MKISDTIQKMKNQMDQPYIFIGGDFNKFNIHPHVESFEDVLLIEAESPATDLLSTGSLPTLANTRCLLENHLFP